MIEKSKTIEDESLPVDPKMYESISGNPKASRFQNVNTKSDTPKIAEVLTYKMPKAFKNHYQMTPFVIGVHELSDGNLAIFPYIDPSTLAAVAPDYIVQTRIQMDKYGLKVMPTKYKVIVYDLGVDD